MSLRLRQVSAAALPPVVFGLLFFGAWEWAVRAFEVEEYFLVPPSKILSTFADNWSLIWESVQVTGANALVGLLLGTALGVAVAFLLMSFRSLDQVITPLSTAVNALPIFVVVSVFSNMYPATSEMPRRLMVAIVIYFVVLVNVARGLRNVQPTHLELMQSYAAGRWAMLRHVRIPNAIPFLFTALKIAAPMAVITAFVSEYFGGVQNGLGSRITASLGGSRKADGWAYVLAACLLGIVFYLISITMEAVATPGGTEHQHRGRSH